MNPQDQNLDATNVFGVPKPRSNSEELFHRELERRSLDIIRVKNPDTKEFFIEWDKRFWRVPAGGTLDVPRYIAIKYCKDKAVETINHLNDKMHEADIEDREKKGLPPFESKWHEQQATYVKSNYPKTGDRTLLTKLYSEYWVGLVYEYGKDSPVQSQSEPESLDMTPIEIKIIKEMENRRVDVADQAPVQEEKPFTGFQSPHAEVAPVSTPVEMPKEEMVEEVTVENAEPENTTPEN
jgi:hypothetical protein